VLPTTPSLSGPLERNLLAVRQRIAVAAAAAGRPPGDVQLLPVTKAVPIDWAARLARLGEGELAENRADGLEAKARGLADRGLRVRWHFVGHLQRNKARRVARLADVVHSVDSPRLAETLARVAEEEGRTLALYLQVDFTGEAAKHGHDEATLAESLALVDGAPALTLLGLMAMGPLVERPGATTRGVFERTGALARSLEGERPGAFEGGRCRLSMGMSGDLELAVAAGSTCVRVGTDLFRGLGDAGGAAR
jgi:pyridoxal phosphate enzyme (YggS family)